MQNNEVKAMVLAAGIGSRLKPLCDVVPKPLIKIGGRTVMDYILLLLKKHGMTDIISNTHHLGDKIENHFKDINKNENINIKFIYEPKLTGVAGGIRACKDFLNQSTACIIMGDALTDANLSKLYKQHMEAVKKCNCIATIAIMEVEDTSQFGVVVTESMLTSTNKNLCSGSKVIKFQEKPTREQALSKWANTGIYFFEPKVFDYIPTETEAAVYDVAHDLFPKLLEANEYLQAVEVEKDLYWADLGTPKQYLSSIKDLSEGKIKLDLLPLISPKAKIAKSAILEGTNEIGDNVVIGENALIKNCVIWDNVIVEENSKLEDCIIGPNSHIKANSELKDKVTVGVENKEHSTELIMR